MLLPIMSLDDAEGCSLPTHFLILLWGDDGQISDLAVYTPLAELLEGIGIKDSLQLYQALHAPTAAVWRVVRAVMPEEDPDFALHWLIDRLDVLIEHYGATLLGVEEDA